MCNHHYNYWYKYGDALFIRPKIELKKCSQCDKINKARNMCNSHYNKWYRHGDPIIKNETSD